MSTVPIAASEERRNRATTRPLSESRVRSAWLFRDAHDRRHAARGRVAACPHVLVQRHGRGSQGPLGREVHRPRQLHRRVRGPRGSRLVASRRQYPQVRRDLGLDRDRARPRRGAGARRQVLGQDPGAHRGPHSLGHSHDRVGQDVGLDDERPVRSPEPRPPVASSHRPAAGVHGEPPISPCRRSSWWMSGRRRPSWRC